MLHNTQSLYGRTLSATDGEIGHVQDFYFDDQTWSIREIEVESGHWYAGKLISLLTGNIIRISYTDSSVYVDLTMEDIRQTAENHVAHV